MDYVFSTTDTKRYRFPTHTNELVMCRSAAQCSEVFIVVLEPGEAPPMHRHDDTEQIFYIIEGEGLLEIGGETEKYAVKAGDSVRIPVSTDHRIHCQGDKPLRYFAVDCFPGGRPTDEPTWDVHARANCDKFSWDYEEVVGNK